jgi:hypothetical protein
MRIAPNIIIYALYRYTGGGTPLSGRAVRGMILGILAKTKITSQ